MTVYRQSSEPALMKASQILALAASDADLDLIGLCMRTGHPTLVGLSDESAIIKERAEGDEKFTFAGLYDECYTLTDLQRMQRRGVRTPEEAPLDTHSLLVDVAIEDVFVVQIKLRADNPGEARARFRALLEKDPEFRTALNVAVLEMVGDDASLVCRIRDTESRVPDLDGNLSWQITKATNGDEC
jgi:hypothetical protein